MINSKCFKAITAIVIIGFVYPSIAFAERKGLMEIYSLANKNDPDFSAENYAALALRESGSLARSGLLPSLGINGSYSYNYSQFDYAGSSSSDFEQQNQGQSISMELRQPLLRFDQISKLRRNNLYQEISHIDEKIAQQSLMLRVAGAYFSVLKEIENLEVEKARKSAFAENLETANIRFKLGSNTITDKLEAQARYDLANSDAIETLNRLSEKQEEIKVITGSVYSLISLKQDTSLPRLTPDDVDYWKSQSATNNLDLKRANVQYQVSRREVGMQRSEYLPKVDLVGSVNHSTGVSFNGNELTRNEASVQLQLDMPLLTGGETHSRVKELVAIRDRQRSLLEQSERKTALTTQVTFMRVVNGYSRLQSLQQALKSSQSAVDGTKKGVEVGIRTNLDLLNAQQQFFETKRDFINLRYDYLYSLLELKAVAGILSVNDLKEQDQLFYQ